VDRFDKLGPVKLGIRNEECGMMEEEFEMWSYEF